MKARLANLWDRLRTSLWFVPTAMTILSVSVAVLMIQVDRGLTRAGVEALGWIYEGGADGARQILATIAGSMITVAGVAFSITIVALTLASQQFGPRLLRNFMRDIGNQVVLGTYIATFIYCLLVLRTIVGRDEIAFVPHVSVTVAVALAIVSFGVLIYFIHHVSSAIQVSNLVGAVAAELTAAIERLYPERIGAAASASHESYRLPDEGYATACSRSGGYVQMLDGDSLLEFARKSDVVIELRVRPGDFIVAGDPIANIHPARQDNGELERRINAAIIVGNQRTATQDPEFAVGQLVEIAVRALSPGVNDPITATNCVDQLGAALCRLVERDYPAAARADRDGFARIYSRPVTFIEVSGSAFDQIRHHGRGDVTVAMRLLGALSRLERRARRDEDVLEVRRQARLVIDGLDRTSIVDADRLEVVGRYAREFAGSGHPPRRS